MTTSQEIIRAARGWVGTRFAHQGRVKAGNGQKGGVDCLGLLVGVAQELELKQEGRLLATLDECDYGHYPDAGRLKAKLAQVMQEVAAIEQGDILLLRVENNPQHLAIVSDYPMGADGLGMIHAYAPARKVVEHRLDEYWRTKIVAVYRFV